MKEIDTSKKNWQKEMSEAMEKNEKFILITDNEELAKGIVEKKLKMKTLKMILLGSAAGGAGIAGLSGIAGIAATSSIVAVADPEPVSKTVMIVVSAICFAIGAGFLYLLIKMLMNNKYKFKIVVSKVEGKFKVEAEPTSN